jgi:hypothetical protein
LRYVDPVARRSRIVGYGTSLVLVLVGTVVAVLRQDTLGLASAVALVSIGLVTAVSLVFYEVGLSEDRERARESDARRRAANAAAGSSKADSPPADPPRRLVRPGRIRGSR